MYALMLRKYVELVNVRHEEDGAEGPEYLALVGGILILLVLVGQLFKNEGENAVANPFMQIFETILGAAGGWVSKLIG